MDFVAYDSDKLLTQVKSASLKEGRVWVAGGARWAPAGLRVPLRAPRAVLGADILSKSEEVLGLNPWQFSFLSCFSEEQFFQGCQHLV